MTKIIETSGRNVKLAGKLNKVEKNTNFTKLWLGSMIVEELFSSVNALMKKEIVMTIGRYNVIK